MQGRKGGFLAARCAQSQGMTAEGVAASGATHAAIAVQLHWCCWRQCAKHGITSLKAHPVQVHETKEAGVYVAGLREDIVSSPEQVCWE